MAEVHRGSAVVIWAAVAASVALAARGSDNNHTVFVGETVAVLLGFSWFLKGSELFNIFREEHGLPPMLRPADLNESTVIKAGAGRRRQGGELS